MATSPKLQPQQKTTLNQAHFNYENNKWPSLSWCDDLEEDTLDVEVTKASAFDPVVGGRNSTRSSSSRSSGSTGFYEQLEMSPTNSLSPHAFVRPFFATLKNSCRKSTHLRKCCEINRSMLSLFIKMIISIC